MFSEQYQSRKISLALPIGALTTSSFQSQIGRSGGQFPVRPDTQQPQFEDYDNNFENLRLQGKNIEEFNEYLK
jgi:hypothetical protein